MLFDITPEESLQRITDYIRELTAPLLASQPAQIIMSPGLVLLEFLDLPRTDSWLLAALLVGWYFWLWLIRGVFFSFGRAAGFASISHYRFFTCLWLPWQSLYQKLLVVLRFFRQQSYGAGAMQQWAGFWEIASYPFDKESGAVPVGRLAFSQRFGLHMPVGIPDGQKHVAYISYAGGGKTSQLMTWLGCLPKNGSALVFDMDGAMVDAFGAVLQAAGHKVVKLDPDRLAKGFDTFGHWNPFDELTAIKKKLGPRYVIEFAEKLSHALIVQDSQTQPVFANQARVFVKALILWVWLMEKDKTLKRLRTLLNRGLPEILDDPGENGFGRLLFEMSAVADKYKDGLVNDGCNGAICEFIANAQGLMSGLSDNSGGSKPDGFKNTAVYQTQWIDDIKIHEMTAFSDLVSMDLKFTNTVVFIVSTLSDMQTRLGPLMRAFVMLALYNFEKVEPKKIMRYPCAFILDEFPNAGKMEAVETALPGFRKYGVRLIVASQSIGLLRAAYPEKYLEFVNQAQCIVWMGIAPTDAETLNLLCSVIGRCIRKEKIDGFHWFPRMLARIVGLQLPPARYQRTPQFLLEPPQASAFLNRAHGQIIVTRESGQAPFRLKRLEYWKDLAVWEYAAHGGHREKFWRRITRDAILAFEEDNFL